MGRALGENPLHKSRRGYLVNSAGWLSPHILRLSPCQTPHSCWQAASVCTMKFWQHGPRVALNIPRRSCRSVWTFINNFLMNKNKRMPKLPLCKKTIFGLHWRRENIDPSPAKRGPCVPKAKFHPAGCFQLQALSAPTVPAYASELQLLGKCWNKSQLSELSLAPRKYFQGFSCIYRLIPNASKFSTPTVIHLLCLDF